MNILGKIKNFITAPFKKVSKTFAVIVDRAGAIWNNRDYENFSKESYMKNVISFRCIDIIAKSLASIPWELYREVNGERVEIDQHEMKDLLKRPNPKSSWFFLMLQGAAYFPIAGNVYFEKVQLESGPNRGKVKELYCLRPDRMTIHTTEDGIISRYEYKVNGKSVFYEVDPLTGRSDILHIKSFHPLDDWYGLATTEPVAREIDSSNEATDFNKNLLENRAVPGMVFIHKENLSDDQFKRLEKQLKDKYSGGVNAGKNMILEGTDDVRPYGFTPAEMDFIESNRELSRRISYGYGVPPQLIGIPGDNTYSNYQEARLAFWEDTIIPLGQHFIGEFNNWLFPESDMFYGYVLDNIAALATKREKLWESAQNSDFLTINEKREMVGFEAIEGGDVILVPATMLPLGEQPSEEEMDETVPPEEEEPVEEVDDENLEEEDEKNIVFAGGGF